MNVNKQVLAELFIFIKDIAVAIRMNSAYTGKPSSPTGDQDVMWLSDALHNFDLFARCLTDPVNASSHINKLIGTYESYLVNDQLCKSNPIETFSRWNIDILHGIRIMKSILE